LGARRPSHWWLCPSCSAGGALAPARPFGYRAARPAAAGSAPLAAFTAAFPITSRPSLAKASQSMKISGVDIRPGNIIEYEGGIWKVAKIQHTQPGKGGAYMQVEMKNLQDGRKTNVRFRSADTVEKVRLDTADYQFLYEDGDMLVFMDQNTYEQISLPSDLLGDARPFLQDGMQVMLELWDEKPISVQLPQQVEAEIVEADAVVKGQTASSSYKPAVLDNGVRIMVPPHIEAGTRIVVDVYEQTYVGKAG
jgi:elongation factor P